MDQFAQTLGAGGAPSTANPLGASDAGLLQNYAKGAYLASAAGRQVGAGTAAAQVQAGNQQQADAYARTLQASALKDKAQAVLDNAQGKNWQQVPKADGGYDFKDGLGRPVTVAQYASATGQDPTKVLAGSKNALDIQHNVDFQRVDALSQALASNDKASLTKLAIQIYGDNSKPATDPVNVKAVSQINKFKQISPADLYQSFMNYYPHVYGAANGGLNPGAPAGGADTIRPNGAFGG